MKALEYLLNLRTNKASFSDANGSIRSVTESFAGLSGAVGNIQNQISKFASSQKWANIASLSKNAIGGIASVASTIKNMAVGGFDFVSDIASAGDSLAKTSRLVGMTVSNLQAFRFAAERSGLSVETLDSALMKFNVNFGKAQSGDKTAGEYFKALLPKDISAYTDAKSAILDIADSYGKLSTAQKAFVSQQLFGRSGLQMTELLSGGSEGVQKLFSEYQDLGGGFSDKAAADAEKFEDDLSNMKVTLSSMKYLVGGELIPVFSELFKTISDYFVKNKDKITTEIRSAVLSISESIKAIIPRIPEIVNGFVAVASVLADIMSYIGPIKTFLAVGVLGSLGSIIPAVISLVGLIGGPVLAGIGLVAVGLVGIVSIVKQFYDNWDMLCSFITDDIPEAIGKVWKSIKDLIGEFVTALGEAVTAFYETFIAPIADFIEGVIQKINDGIQSALNFARNIPIVGEMFGGSKAPEAGSPAEAAQAVVSESRTTTTSRFSVDFNNLPQGASVTAPQNGDFDYSYGYTLGGF